MELQENDVLVFKNGHRKEYTDRDKWMMENFYDDKLNCTTNDKFTVVKVLRPHYEVVFTKEKQAPARKLQK